MNPIRVLVVDDHPVVRKGIRSLLSNYADLSVVGEAADGDEALAMFREHAPHVTLLDIRMPGMSGLEVLRSLRALQPKARVLMLTSFEDEEYVFKALRAGAQGYILKSASDELLVNAIRSVHAGEQVLSPRVTGHVVQRLLSEPLLGSSEGAAAPEFDEEERRILQMLVDGASNAEIAGALFVSHTTVKRKLRSIFEQLKVSSRTEAAAEAVRRGIV